ncbi:MAG: hypothetical protein IH865_04215 [Chloroflexi bacterium]|nr:hypothetical protein [Chloroflexota bacterium]
MALLVIAIVGAAAIAAITLLRQIRFHRQLQASIQVLDETQILFVRKANSAMDALEAAAHGRAEAQIAATSTEAADAESMAGWFRHKRSLLIWYLGADENVIERASFSRVSSSWWSAMASEPSCTNRVFLAHASRGHDRRLPSTFYSAMRHRPVRLADAKHLLLGAAYPAATERAAAAGAWAEDQLPGWHSESIIA